MSLRKAKKSLREWKKTWGRLLLQASRSARQTRLRLRIWWRVSRRVRVTRRAFRVIGLLKKPVPEVYRMEIRDFWRKHYGKAPSLLWHQAITQVTGRKDPRFIPHHFWVEEILPFFNCMAMRPGLMDKNLSELWLRVDDGPKVFVRRMKGAYYDASGQPISRCFAWERMVADGHPKIIKAAQIDGGKGVKKFETDGNLVLLDGKALTLVEIEKRFGRDFLIQEIVVQHATMAAPHPTSVNSLRVVTMRWRGEIRLLTMFARFGIAGRLTDNAGTGGICCGVDLAEGRFRDHGVDETGERYDRHPTTAYDFGLRALVPGFERVRQRAAQLHQLIHHFDLVSWDFAVSPDAQPIFMELNFIGLSYVYQFATGTPIFGELTAEVLEAVRDRRLPLKEDEPPAVCPEPVVDGLGRELAPSISTDETTQPLPSMAQG